MFGETTWDPDTAPLALQFQDLFGQDVLYEDANSPFYDEQSSNMLVPNTSVMETISPPKRRRNSSSSSSSSFYSSEEDDDDGDSFSALHSYRSDEEQVPTLGQRRQIEDLILDKITNQLDPEKLPGILTIISTNHEEEEEEEVEIDLAILNIDQLTRILSYIDACLLEKNGGPKVRPFDYAVKKKPNKTRRHRSIVDQGHIVEGSSYASSLGPMASIIESEDDVDYLSKRKKRTKRKTNKNNKQKQNRKKEKTAKKRSTIHKRRLLEEMLHPQNAEEDTTEGGNEIIIFGDEEMDFAVTQNETIAHKETVQQPTKEEYVQYHYEDDDDDDELIDIMM